MTQDQVKKVSPRRAVIYSQTNPIFLTEVSVKALASSMKKSHLRIGSTP